MSIVNKTHYGSGGDLGFLPTYNANPAQIPTLTATNTVAETATINGLARSPFAILQEFNISLDFEDDEETKAINCGQETFLSKATKFATVGGIILQNNDLDSLQYLLGGDRVTNIVDPERTDEYRVNQLGTFLKPKTAFRFVSCPYQVTSDPDGLLWRQDYIYIADAVIDGGIEDAYKAGTESFEGITFTVKSTSKSFQKVVRRALTEADLA